ncbi:MAG: hypothetical protein CMJ67_06045 [Planctomycetaceae bacterium]|nr:hypothetical protein [Planctomycetaceae bacterium]
MKLFPAILTGMICLTCSPASLGGVALVDDSDLEKADFRVAAPPIDVEPAFRFRVRMERRAGIPTSEKGDFESGPWIGFDLEGARRVGDVVPWLRISSADRLRLGREVLRRADLAKDVPSLALLAVALSATEQDSVSARAVDTAVRYAGDQGLEVREAMVSALDEHLMELEERRNAATSVSMALGRPHLAFDAPGGGPIDPALMPAARARQRVALDDAIAGLGLNVVPTGLSITAAAGTLEEVSRIGVRLDRHLEQCASRIGLSPEERVLPGALVYIAPEEADQARLLIATVFDHRWPDSDRSMMFCPPDGPWAVVKPPDAAVLEQYRRAGVAGDDAARRRMAGRIEEALAAGRATMLHARGGARLPAWLVEGFAETSAASLVKDSPIESMRRPRAVRGIRMGRSPLWILSVDPDSPEYGFNGSARDLAMILVQRLLETRESTLPGIVADLKAGATPDEAFRRRTGMTLQAWLADAGEWFLYND